MANCFLRNNLSALQKTTITVILVLLFFVISLTGCSDNIPMILTTQNTVVYEYADIQSLPETRLSVYVIPSNEISRFNYLTVEKKDENLSWSIKDADIYTTKEGVYVGYSRFVPAAGNTFKSGTYYVTYFDAASRSAQTHISVKTSSDLHTKKFSELGDEVFSLYLLRKIVIYDIEGGLVYFGDEITESTTDDEIRKRYPSATSYRRLFGTKNDSSVILAPPVLLLQGEEND